MGYPTTEREHRFAVEYIECGNVPEAAKRAGYSESFCGTLAYRLPQKLWKFLGEQQTSRANGSPVTPSQLIKEYASIAMANEDDFHDISYKDGKRLVTAKPWASLSREQKAAVADFYKDAEGNDRYKLHPKMPAMHAIGKYLGMFNDKLIIERRNIDVKAVFNFSGVPTAQLLALEQQLKTLRGAPVLLEAPQ